MWHGEAIAQVLEAHGEQAGAPRIAALRHGHRRRQALTTASTIGSAAFAGRAFVALHMTWGAVNEWTTQAGYARLVRDGGPSHAARAPAAHHETGGRAHRLLRVRSDPAADESPKAQKMTRFALSHWWRPVGSGVMPKKEVGFLVKYLFAGDKGADLLERIDRRVDRLPGQRNLHLLTRAVAQLSA